MDTLISQIRHTIAQTAGIEESKVKLEHPETEAFGDLASNAALIVGKSQITNFKLQTESNGQNNTKELAEKMASEVRKIEGVKATNVAGPGFVNISIQNEPLIKEMNRVLKEGWKGFNHAQIEANQVKGKKIMVEYAHPNTHKEMHIGHLRTLITGEALARLLTAAGAEVFRANYQGDIGPHVAKAIWGTKKLMEQRGLTWEEAEKFSIEQRVHLLGEGYVEGNREYDSQKEEIDTLNRQLYAQENRVKEDYQRTRKWSLDYYDNFYRRLGTRFDRLFFESEVADKAKQLVESQVGKVFTRSEGAIVFEGEKYGLHTRVFETAQGTPTYEGKDIALAYEQFATFPFDRNIHVVANEQTGYFKVIIAALEKIDHQFKGREYHLPMGMVNLVGQKMSSRTGVILRVDDLLDQVKGEALALIKLEGINEAEKDEIAEKVTVGAIKYSVLKSQPVLDVAFDIKQSVSLEGNSGPYLQYTYARTRSVLRKANKANQDLQLNYPGDKDLEPEEMAIIRYIYRFSETVVEAANRLAPNLVAGYLYELASRFNFFYNKLSILTAESAEKKQFRLAVTAVVGETIKTGLDLLGIQVPERM